MCRSCTKCNLNDLNTVSRNDIFGACHDCLPAFMAMIEGQAKGNKVTDDRANALGGKMDAFATKLDKIIEMQEKAIVGNKRVELRTDSKFYNHTPINQDLECCVKNLRV